MFQDSGTGTLIADRGYESYNVLAHARENGWKFLIQAKDLGDRGILPHLLIPDHWSFRLYPIFDPYKEADKGDYKPATHVPLSYQ